MEPDSEPGRRLDSGVLSGIDLPLELRRELDVLLLGRIEEEDGIIWNTVGYRLIDVGIRYVID